GSGVQMSFFIEAPEVKNYSLIGANGVAWDIDLCTVKCGSGSGSYSLEIDSGSGPTAVTGISAQAISTSESQATATGANSLTAGGERLILDISANNSMTDLEVTIKGTTA
ncbi:MAG TPA: hypothetical protein VKN76_12210, partial [Kiloniellaceae bacterium]|nr:hypothetical protein [Kiloniellaceae bacterium]